MLPEGLHSTAAPFLESPQRQAMGGVRPKTRTGARPPGVSELDAGSSAPSHSPRSTPCARSG